MEIFIAKQQIFFFYIRKYPSKGCRGLMYHFLLPIQELDPKGIHSIEICYGSCIYDVQ